MKFDKRRDLANLIENINNMVLEKEPGFRKLLDKTKEEDLDYSSYPDLADKLVANLVSLNDSAHQSLAQAILKLDKAKNKFDKMEERRGQKLEHDPYRLLCLELLFPIIEEDLSTAYSYKNLENLLNKNMAKRAKNIISKFETAKIEKERTEAVKSMADRQTELLEKVILGISENKSKERMEKIQANKTKIFDEMMKKQDEKINLITSSMSDLASVMKSMKDDIQNIKSDEKLKGIEKEYNKKLDLEFDDKIEKKEDDDRKPKEVEKEKNEPKTKPKQLKRDKTEILNLLHKFVKEESGRNQTFYRKKIENEGYEERAVYSTVKSCGDDKRFNVNRKGRSNLVYLADDVKEI